VTPRTIPSPLVSEAAWQETMVDLLRSLGWKSMHVRRSIGKGRKWATTTSVVGWPDLFCWHEGQGRTLAVELKTDTGQLSDHQDAVLASLRAAGQEVRVWHPRDWESIVADLKGHR
jgi:hypothetical protein